MNAPPTQRVLSWSKAINHRIQFYASGQAEPKSCQPFLLSKPKAIRPGRPWQTTQPISAAHMQQPNPLAPNVVCEGLSGVLGVTVDPEFSTNRYICCIYSYCNQPSSMQACF